MRKILTLSAVALFSFGGMAAPDAKNMELAKIFYDNLVLQRGVQVPVWGTAAPGGTVAVVFNGQTKEAKVDRAGNWMAWLDPMQAGGPFGMTIRGGAKTLELANVMVGDVWLCSGQSNMGYGIDGKELEPCPDLRLCTVPEETAGEPQSDFNKAYNYWWFPCLPGKVRLSSQVESAIPGFSAVAYYFGRELQKQLKVPIGLIHNSYGGTFGEAWGSLAALEKDPDFRWLAEKYKTDHAQKLAETEEQFNQAKQAIYRIREQFGAGRKEIETGWTKLNYDDKDWPTLAQPGGWPKTTKDGTALVDFRKRIEIPAAWTGQDLIVSLGTIDEYDRVFYNGTDIGSIGHSFTMDYWAMRRAYTVPAQLVNSSNACIAVRIANVRGAGGFTGAPEDLFIGLKAGGAKRITLAGDWKCLVRQPIKWSGFPLGPGNPLSPSVLYNAMVNPLAPFAIKGVIWYQGEGNADRAYKYRKLLPLLINCWRERWRQASAPGAAAAGDDIPFLIVQLANFMEPPVQPEESSWAELREAQALAAENVPRCALAVAIDLGEAENIHPRNKLDVGKRLALAALKTAYGQDIVCSGPVYSSMEISAGKIRVKFKNIGGGLAAKGGALKQFAIAGRDRKYYWANATIDGDTVVVWSEAVKAPVSVRYAWANNPAGCNLYNQEGLPAVPFRTDDYKGITYERK